MTPKIDSQIAQIRTIFLQLKSKIEQEKDVASRLNEELVEAKNVIEKLNNEIDNLQQENKRLTALADAKQEQQEVEPNLFNSNSRNDAEIDALVKEIDFCIAQLKNNHG